MSFFFFQQFHPSQILSSRRLLLGGSRHSGERKMEIKRLYYPFHPLVVAHVKYWSSHLASHPQGGFCGAADAMVEVPQEEGSSGWKSAHPWPLEDVGTPQTLDLPQPLTTTSLRLTFPSSTDFFGRIIMYKLDVLGKKLWQKIVLLWCLSVLEGVWCVSCVYLQCQLIWKSCND